MIRKYHKLHFNNWDFSKINQDLPISLKDFESIVQRVYLRYPLIKKSKIAFIIKCFMEEIREKLLDGYMINMPDFASRLRLYSYYQVHYNKVNITTTVQLTTPKKIREQNE